MNKLRYWTTSNIEQVLNENYLRGVNGTDFEDIKSELELILWDREAKQRELDFKQHEKESL